LQIVAGACASSDIADIAANAAAARLEMNHFRGESTVPPRFSVMTRRCKATLVPA
jgi:hypothetical protein